MIKFTRILKGGLLSAVAGFFAAGVVTVGQVSEADAALMLRLTSGADSVTVTDGGVGDLDGVANGLISFNSALGGSVGNFNVNVTTGISKPIIGSPQFPQLDLNSVNVSGSGAGSISIEVTDTNFTVSGNALFASDVGGTTQGSVSVSTFVDDSNTAFGQATSLADLGPFSGPGTQAFSGSSANYATLAPFSSATIVALITHTEPGQITSFDAAITVDAPGTLALLGIGLVGLGLASRRRQRSKAA